uniref:ARAD1C28490p n=1 Tax=Blastobotrys adeninivorans TaxID=409370 RepID=A0A060T222_BLAAD
MLNLPPEIIHIVCEYDVECVPSLSQTCSHLRNVILRYDRLWKELCEPLFRSYPRIDHPAHQSYYHFYWQQKAIERTVTRQLENARKVENYGPILVSIAEMGPRTEPALKRHARLFDHTQSFEGIADAYCADITLTTVRRRAAIEHINEISRNPNEHDVVDLLLTLNTLCSESSQDVVDLDSILEQVQYPYHTHTAQQEAIALVDEVRKVIQSSLSRVSADSNNGRVNGVVNLRRLYSFMFVCAYCQLARQHGFTVSTRMFKASMKWHGVFDMSRGSEQGFVVVVTDKAEVWTKQQLDNYFSTHPVSWANPADVACEAAFSMFQFSLDARTALITTASIAKIFQTKGQFMHFKSPTSLQLEGSDDQVIQLDNGELSALAQAQAFLPLLNEKYINPGYVSDGWFGRVIQDERLTGKRYAVVWHRQGSEDDHMYTVLNSQHKYERLYHRHTAAANPTASELWTQFRSDGIRRLGRAFSGYDQQRGVFVPRTNFSVTSSIAASS